MRVLVAAALAAVAAPAVAPAAADPACDAGAAAALRDREARGASRWNLGWGLGFAAAGLAQAGMAYGRWVPLRTVDDALVTSMYVGAVKSAIGVLSHVVLPLRAPAIGDDACAAARATAVRERRSFALAVVGGLAVNLAGSAYVVYATDDWGEAATSFGIGVVVLAAHAWTEPRRAWRARRRGVVWAPVVVPGARPMLAIAGSF